MQFFDALRLHGRARSDAVLSPCLPLYLLAYWLAQSWQSENLFSFGCFCELIFRSKNTESLPQTQ